MQSAPPKNFHYSLIKSFQDQLSAYLIYLFSKTGIETTMCQLFEIQNNKIRRLELIFDTAVLQNT